MELGLEIQKTNAGIRISILEILCVNLQAKQTVLTFSVQNFLIMDLDLETQKTYVSKRNNILEIPCVPIFK